MLAGDRFGFRLPGGEVIVFRVEEIRCTARRVETGDIVIHLDQLRAHGDGLCKVTFDVLPDVDIAVGNDAVADMLAGRPSPRHGRKNADATG